MGLAHTKFLSQWVNGLEEYRKNLELFSLEAAAQLSGIPEETIRTVAHMIAEAKSMCVLWAMGVTQHSQGSDISTAISNLLLVTGNYMSAGTGAYPRRGQVP
jgi:formate dehydrogenase major subunit